MANYEHKEGSATLFRNDKKSSEKQPDWRGDGLFQGKKVKIAAWEKSGSKGTFFSLKIEEDTYKQEKTGFNNRGENYKTDGGKFAQGGFDIEDSEIPFSPLRKNEIAGW